MSGTPGRFSSAQNNMGFLITLVLIVGAVIGLIALVAYLDGCSKRTAVLPPAPTPVEPPKELSCLVKGIIKSMKDEPDAWDVKPAECGIYSWGFNAAHRTAKISVHARVSVTTYAISNTDHPYYGMVEHRQVPGFEAKVLFSAVENMHRAESSKADEARKHEAAPRIQYFEKLGCPGGET
jgi:hypothetical protein